MFRDSVIRRARADEIVRRQALILEQLYDAVIVVDLDDRISDWNPAAERIFSYSKDEMLGKTTDVLYESEEQAIRVKTEISEHMNSHGRWVGESNNVRKDGTPITIETVMFGLHDESDEIVSTVTVGRDITARKQVEGALRESEKLLATVLDHMPMPVYLRDLDGRTMLINREYERFNQVTREAIRGKTLYDYFPKDEVDHYMAHDRDVIARRQPLEREETHRRSDGEHIFAVVKFPIFDLSDEVVAIGGVDLDITERKRAEDQLRESEERFRAVSQSASDAIISVDERGLIVSWNRGAEQIFGYTAEQVMGKSLKMLMPEEYHERHAAVVERLNSGDEPRVIGRTLEFEGLA